MSKSIKQLIINKDITPIYGSKEELYKVWIRTASIGQSLCGCTDLLKYGFQCFGVTCRYCPLNTYTDDPMLVKFFPNHELELEVLNELYNRTY